MPIWDTWRQPALNAEDKLLERLIETHGTDDWDVIARGLPHRIGSNKQKRRAIKQRWTKLVLTARATLSAESLKASGGAVKSRFVGVQWHPGSRRWFHHTDAQRRGRPARAKKKRPQRSRAGRIDMRRVSAKQLHASEFAAAVAYDITIIQSAPTPRAPLVLNFSSAAAAALGATMRFPLAPSAPAASSAAAAPPSAAPRAAPGAAAARSASPQPQPLPRSDAEIAAAGAAALRGVATREELDQIAAHAAAVAEAAADAQFAARVLRVGEDRAAKAVEDAVAQVMRVARPIVLVEARYVADANAAAPNADAEEGADAEPPPSPGALVAVFDAGDAAQTLLQLSPDRSLRGARPRPQPRTPLSGDSHSSTGWLVSDEDETELIAPIAGLAAALGRSMGNFHRLRTMVSGGAGRSSIASTGEGEEGGELEEEEEEEESMRRYGELDVEGSRAEFPRMVNESNMAGIGTLGRGYRVGGSGGGIMQRSGGGGHSSASGGASSMSAIELALAMRNGESMMGF